MTFDTTTLTSILAVAGAGAAIFERVRSVRLGERAKEAAASTKAHEDVIVAKNELYEVAKMSAEQWKARFTLENEDYKRYREEHHAIVQKTQATILTQTEEIATLRARTDITPVLETLTKIMEGMKTIMSSMAPITIALDRITQRIDHIDENERRNTKHA